MLVKSKAIDEAYHKTEVVFKALMEANAAHEEAKAAYEVAVKTFQRIYHEEKSRLYPEFEQ